MKKILLTCIVLFSSFLTTQPIQNDAVKVELTKRPTYERNNYVAPVPVVPVTNEYSKMDRQGKFETIQLIIPKKESASENGIMEVSFRGGSKGSRPLILISDYKSKSPRFYVDHNQNGNFEDDGPFQHLIDNDHVDILLSNAQHAKGQLLSRLVKMEIKDQKSRDNWNRNIKRGPRFANATLAQPDFWFKELRFNILSADVEVDGIKFQLGLMDWNLNGLYTDDEDRILVGEYGNDRMSIDLNDNNYEIGDNSPFAVGNKGFVITGMDKTGRSMSFKPIDYSNVPSKLKIGDPLPEINVATFDGDPVALHDLMVTGKYNFIDFWGIWCKGCVVDIPNIRTAAEEFKDKLNVVGLHSGKISSEKMDAFVKKNQMTWRQKMATSEAELAFKISGFPYGILINPEGKIVAFNIRIEEVVEILSDQQ